MALFLVTCLLSKSFFRMFISILPVISTIFILFCLHEDNLGNHEYNTIMKYFRQLYCFITFIFLSFFELFNFWSIFLNFTCVFLILSMQHCLFIYKIVCCYISIAYYWFFTFTFSLDLHVLFINYSLSDF